jgi:hypothetical protein
MLSVLACQIIGHYFVCDIVTLKFIHMGDGIPSPLPG